MGRNRVHDSDDYHTADMAAADPYQRTHTGLQRCFVCHRWIGSSYVWIYFLCILWDNSRDWEQDSAVMHRVYRIATCCLSASCFESSWEGLLGIQRLYNPLGQLIQSVWQQIWQGSASDQVESDQMEQRLVVNEPHLCHIISENKVLGLLCRVHGFSRSRYW